MRTNKKKSKRKILLIIGICFVSVLVVIILTIYLMVHNYINKMNLVPTDDYPKNQVLDVEDFYQEEKLLQEEELESSLLQEFETEAIDIADSSEDAIISTEEEIRHNMEQNQTQIISDKEVMNIILIGSDTRKPGGKGRSDAIILISINKETRTITATSILRDIYLQIFGKKNNRINAAYALGGADLLMDTIKRNFKLEVNRYAAVDFFAFIDIVDAVGGITIDVTAKEIPVINEYVASINRLMDQEEMLHQLSEPGTLLLNGKQALGYVRNRYVGNNDFERTERQRRALEQIFLKVKDIGLLELDNLLNKILPQVTTNLTRGEILNMILSLPSYAKYDIQQWSIPMKGSYTNLRIRGMSVLGIDFERNIQELRKMIYDIE